LVIIPTWLVCLLANQHETFTWKDTISVFSVSQGSVEALIKWGGKCSNIWLLAFSVTFLPNILKIRQCFLELWLKMSGMFFLRHSVCTLCLNKKFTLLIFVITFQTVNQLKQFLAETQLRKFWTNWFMTILTFIRYASLVHIVK